MVIPNAIVISSLAILTYMDGLTVNITWEWALGIVGTLIVIAWYGSGRFTSLEKDMQWVKDILNELKTGKDNDARPAFGPGSPIVLNNVGERWIVDSGLKQYVEDHKSDLVKACDETKIKNPYEVQKQAFKVLDELQFETEFENKLKEFAYQQGTSVAVMRRIGGIFLRDLCIAEYHMNKSDIDKHDPTKSSNNKG